MTLSRIQIRILQEQLLHVSWNWNYEQNITCENKRPPPTFRLENQRERFSDWFHLAASSFSVIYCKFRWYIYARSTLHWFYVWGRVRNTCRHTAFSPRHPRRHFHTQHITCLPPLRSSHALSSVLWSLPCLLHSLAWFWSSSSYSQIRYSLFRVSFRDIHIAK